MINIPVIVKRPGLLEIAEQETDGGLGVSNGSVYHTRRKPEGGIYRQLDIL